MSEPNGSRPREPVFVDGKRVSGLYRRTTADGRVVFEFNGRLDGRMRRVRLRAMTKTDAVNEARGLVVDIRRGDLKLGDRTITLQQLRDSFIARETGPLARLAPRTAALYAERLDHHVLPVLGRTTRAANVRVEHIRLLIDRLRDKNLSGSTVRGCVTATSSMFRHGVRELGALGDNPVRHLDRGDRPSGKRLTEPRYLSVEEIERLLGALSNEFRPVAACCFWGALRVSEALGLCWGNVSFEESTIVVPGTKTVASAATIPMLPALARELRAHRERHLALGFDRLRPEGAVFLTPSGKAPTRRNVYRAVSCAARRVGLQRGDQQPVGIHDLRHSLAANAFALRLPPNEVARLLRHASTKVTLAIYDGVVETGAVERLRERLAAGGLGQ